MGSNHSPHITGALLRRAEFEVYLRALRSFAQRARCAAAILARPAALIRRRVRDRVPLTGSGQPGEGSLELGDLVLDRRSTSLLL